MKRTLEYLLAGAAVALFCSAALGQMAVTTQRNDNGRTGANLSETVLNTSNVNGATFGKLVSHLVDGKIYAQILYVPNVAVPGRGAHNVVYVSTLNNSVYAFDADDVTTSAALWQVNLGPPVPVLIYSPGFTENIGILSTPVIDVPSQTLYVVAETSIGANTVFQLHALDLATGAEKFNGPVQISGGVPGTASDSVNGLLAFAPEMHLQRPGLLLLNGNVYISFGSHDDTEPWHGWMFGYSATSLQQTGILCLSPNADASAIWQGGVGLTADANGNIYVMTGNGQLDVPAGGKDYGDSFVKISTAGGLRIVDYFSPSNQAVLDSNDWDLGSGGPLLIPGTSLLVGGGKDGRLFLVDSNNMGQFGATDHMVQEWTATNAIFAGHVYYDSKLYVWGQNDALKVFAFNGSTFNTTPVSQSSTIVPYGYSNEPAMSLSANGTTPATGILWATYSAYGSSNGGQYPGILRAFDAADVTHELWNSELTSYRDAVGSWAKWSPPTIANGKVYLGTFSNVFHVYGLLGGNPPPATASFVGTDLTTQGNWKGVYGSDGYAVVGDSTNYPAYVQAYAADNSTYVWAAQPDTDPRALQRAVAAGRIAATWDNPTSLIVDVQVTDGNPHRVALYNLDWDSTTRAQRVDILDWNSGNVLDSRTVTGFHGGQYYIWTISGHVAIRITMTAGANAVLSGIFFDAAATTTSYAVSGTITLGGAALSGVNLAATGGVNCTASDAAGHYTCTVPQGWSGTVTPSLNGYSFMPSARSYNSVAANQMAQDYVATTTTLSSSLNPAIVGSSVTFTATITGSAPTGTVGFTDNSNAISGCTAQPVSAGKATCATTALTVGSHSIVATYSGDAANAASASAPLAQVINASSSGAASFVGTDLTTQGNWKGVYGSDGYAVIGDSTHYPAYAAVTPTGNSTYVWAAQPDTDPRALQRAVVAGRIAATWFSSTSFTVDVNVTDGNPHRVALYNLDWDSTTRAQRVDILDGNSGSVLDSRTVTGFHGGQYFVWTVSGHVMIRITMTAGANAVLSGIFFDKAVTTTTTLSSSLNPAIVGASVTFTATITGSAPTGTVGFASDGSAISGCTAQAVSAGKATCATAALTVGSHSIVATYSGDGNNAGSTSPTLTQTVNKAASSTTLASSANPSTFGTSVTFTATVTGNSPTGTVGFTDNGSAISGCAAQAVSAGKATCATAALTVGSHSIVATYSGDAGNNTSTSPTLTQTVNKAASSTTLASSANPSTSGTSVTFTATVTGSAPTGTVGFTDNGSAISGCTAQAVSAGKATCATAALTVGSHSIVATYSGDAANAASASAPLAQVINASSSGAASFVGTDLTTQGNWKGVYGSDGYAVIGDSTHYPAYAAVTPTGNSTYVWAAQPDTDPRALQRAVVAGRIAATWFSSTSFTVDVNVTDGNPHRVALYNLDWDSTTRAQRVDILDGNSGSVLDSRTVTGFHGGQYFVWTVSGHVMIRITMTAGANAVLSGIFFDKAVTTTTTLSSSLNPAIVGASVTFTATITGSAPTGTVGFASDGSAISGCTAQAVSAGKATCATAALTVGSHSIVATYSGDGNNAGSTSPTLTQTVNKAASSTTLASSANPSTFGTSVTFTATVTGNSPTGTVGFTDNGSAISGCTAQAVSAGKATCATAALTVGSHSIVATYGGDANNNGSTSPALAQTVNSVGGSTNVALAANGGVASASSTYSAGYPVSAINNGDRTGAGWGNGGGWNDATANTYPDWVQIVFNGQKTIDHVVVVTLQDNFESPIQPTASTTFTLFGVTDFTVQAWNGSSWVTLGTVAGNNLVMRTVNFTAVTTDRIRVNITGALGSYSRLVEVEAWGN